MTERIWFVFKGDHHLGPFSRQELIDLLDQQELQESELIWCEGRAKWQPINQVDQFVEVFNPFVPPVAAPPQFEAVEEVILEEPMAPPEVQEEVKRLQAQIDGISVPKN